MEKLRGGCDLILHAFGFCSLELIQGLSRVAVWISRVCIHFTWPSLWFLCVQWPVTHCFPRIFTATCLSLSLSLFSNEHFSPSPDYQELCRIWMDNMALCWDGMVRTNTLGGKILRVYKSSELVVIKERELWFLTALLCMYSNQQCRDLLLHNRDT